MRDSTPRNQAKGYTRLHLQIDEAHEHGRSNAAVAAAAERPVAAADGNVTVGPLGRAVVDLQVAILEKARQRH